MIRSMTAFSRVSGNGKKSEWVVEIRSLNSKYFDFSVRLPPDYYDYETQIRDLVRKYIVRGKIAVNVTRVSESETPEFELNQNAVKKYLGSVKKLKKKFRVPGEVTVREILMLPQIFEVKKSKDSTRQGWADLQKLLKQASEKAILAKKLEGAKIAKDIKMRLTLIEKAADKIKQLTKDQAGDQYLKLKERINKILQPGTIDDEKVLKEAAVLADRTDITEELVRMKSHTELFRNRLNSEREIGRELDFLCQEMHREINTMGSKSQSSDISRQVIAVKGEIEKIREQVQNVE